MTLLKWALVFFVVSIIAALFGFTDIAAASADVAHPVLYLPRNIYRAAGARFGAFPKILNLELINCIAILR